MKKFSMILLFLAFLCITTFAQQQGSFTDKRDGKKYKTVKIGWSQTWMAENLNYMAGKSACYENNELICQKCGRLYDWVTATAICPSGWHLPDNEEWNRLANDIWLRTDYISILNMLNCGFGYPEGDFNSYGESNSFWSATSVTSNDWEHNTAYQWSSYVKTNYKNEQVIKILRIGDFSKKFMYSVRCVKD